GKKRARRKKESGLNSRSPIEAAHGHSAEEGAGRDDAAERNDERDVGEAGDDDAARAPPTVGFAGAPKELGGRGRQEKGGHDAPFKPTHGNVDGKIRQGVRGRAVAQLREHGGTQEIDDHAKDESQKESQQAEKKGVGDRSFASASQYGKAQVHPADIGDKLGQEVEQSGHGPDLPAENFMTTRSEQERLPSRRGASREPCAGSRRRSRSVA